MEICFDTLEIICDNQNFPENGGKIPKNIPKLCIRTLRNLLGSAQYPYFS
jgi:hypothetical protein